MCGDLRKSILVFPDTLINWATRNCNISVQPWKTNKTERNPAYVVAYISTSPVTMIRPIYCVIYLKAYYIFLACDKNIYGSTPDDGSKILSRTYIVIYHLSQATMYIHTHNIEKSLPWKVKFPKYSYTDIVKREQCYRL